MRHVSMLLVLALFAGLFGPGCVTPAGTYTIDTIQAMQILSLISQAVQIAQDQGLLPPPGQPDAPEQIDYRQRLLDLLFAAIERNIADVNLSDLVQKAKT